MKPHATLYRNWKMFALSFALSATACSSEPKRIALTKDAVVDAHEGSIAVGSGRVRFRIVGPDKPGIPLLVLHGGGPNDGAWNWASTEKLETLADERPVILYGQSGGGIASRLDKTQPRIADFVAEIGQVRAALGLSQVHVLGHSWGTRLLVDYMLTQPAGVASIVLEGPCVSESRQRSDRELLLAQLSPGTRDAITQHEAAGTTDGPEYLKAIGEFNQKFFARDRPPSTPRPPAPRVAALRKAMQDELDHYERADRLGEIRTPALFTCGEYDICTPAASAYYQSKLPGAKLVIVPNAAHFPHAEQPKIFLSALREFLRSAEAASTR